MENTLLIPQHIALILDGNRRWAVEHGLPKLAGHTKGAENVRRIAKAALDQGVPFVTMYVLSTENLKGRSQEELAHLFFLFGTIVDYLDKFLKHEIRFRVVGDTTKLPPDLQDRLTSTVEKTKHHKRLTLTFAINYGGRDEIKRAVQKIVKDNITEEQITEKLIASYLDTQDIPEVDLVIRTGGDQRLSNYLLWQSAYAELYFTKTFWPAFSAEDLAEAISWFQQQKRNRGK